MNEKKIEFMNEKKWNDFDVRPSKIFGYEVPVYTPSIFREFRVKFLQPIILKTIL